jgi:uncharacterized protein
LIVYVKLVWIELHPNRVAVSQQSGGALKRGLNPRTHELGIRVCGGRGRHSRQTPAELFRYADGIGLNGDSLVRSNRLAARIDNNAIADGFQLCLHGFIVAASGEWMIVQQGMNGTSAMARRYPWLSATVKTSPGNRIRILMANIRAQS